VALGPDDWRPPHPFTPLSSLYIYLLLLENINIKEQRRVLLPGA
jgi:hypothetical protein